MHSTCAAHPHAATVLGSGEVKQVTQGPKQRHLSRSVNAMLHVVHNETEQPHMFACFVQWDVPEGKKVANGMKGRLWGRTQSFWVRIGDDTGHNPTRIHSTGVVGPESPRRGPLVVRKVQQEDLASG